jgi:hypothetical protein
MTACPRRSRAGALAAPRVAFHAQSTVASGQSGARGRQQQVFQAAVCAARRRPHWRVATTGDRCSQQRYLPAAPMMAMPVTTPSPMTVTPAPMTATPTPMTMVPAPVMATPPPHLLRLEPFDLLARCHGWMGICFIFNERLRKQRSGLRSRGKRGRTGCKSNSEFQKLSAFHGVLSCRIARDAERVSPPRSEQRLNLAFS